MVFAFPAVVPEAEVSRSDVVAARVARKVAPLFGVRWDGNPFGRTWVCDLAQVTLAELARGAPMPQRQQQALLDEAAASSGAGGTEDRAEAGEAWRLVGRAVWTPGRTPTPAALTNATLNRYGPDTKAAAVLVGVNRLLVEATAAVTRVCRDLAVSGVPEPVRLAVWAGLILEVFRAQPALLVAGVQARSVQLALTSSWSRRLEVPDGLEVARCEVGPAAGANGDPHRPVTLDLVDSTLAALSLEAFGSDALADVASAWCRRLLLVGRPGRGVLWLDDDGGGHRAVRCYLRVGAVVAPFVAEVFGDAEVPVPHVLPSPPDHGSLGREPLLVVRAQLLAAYVAVNYLRYRDELYQRWPAMRAGTRAFLAEVADRARGRLGNDDPATLLVDGYLRHLALWDELRSGAGDVRELERLVDMAVGGQATVARLWRAGVLDPGAATYLLEITNVVLEQAGEVLQASPRRDRAIHGWWLDALRARGLDESQLGRRRPATSAVDGEVRRGGYGGEPTAAQLFHLQHYAAHLAARGGRAGVSRALELQGAVAKVRDDVALAEPVRYASKYTAARTAHELAARLALAVAGSLEAGLPARPGSGRTAEVRRVRAAGLAHARAVLDNPTTRLLLLGTASDISVAWAAASALPVVVDAVRRGEEKAGGLLAEQARALGRAALAFWRDPQGVASFGHLPGPAELEAWIALLTPSDVDVSSPGLLRRESPQ